MLRTLLVVACATIGRALPTIYHRRVAKETLNEKLARTDSTLERALAKIDELDAELHFERGEHKYASENYYEREFEYLMKFGGCVAAIAADPQNPDPIVDFNSCGQEDENLKAMYKSLISKETDKWKVPTRETRFKGFGMPIENLHGDTATVGKADDDFSYFTMQLKSFTRGHKKCSVIGHTNFYLIVVWDITCGGQIKSTVQLHLHQLIQAWVEASY